MQRASLLLSPALGYSRNDDALTLPHQAFKGLVDDIAAMRRTIQPRIQVLGIGAEKSVFSAPGRNGLTLPIPMTMSPKLALPLSPPTSGPSPSPVTRLIAATMRASISTTLSTEIGADLAMVVVG